MIYSSIYQTVEYDKENGIYVEVFLPECENLSEEKYKTDMLALVDAMAKYQLKGGIVDFRDFKYSIAPELQTWHNENIFTKAVGIGLTFMAIIVSHDIFAEVSVQQTLEEAEGQKFKTQYFDNFDNAKQWALQMAQNS